MKITQIRLLLGAVFTSLLIVGSVAFSDQSRPLTSEDIERLLTPLSKILTDSYEADLDGCVITLTRDFGLQPGIGVSEWTQGELIIIDLSEVSDITFIDLKRQPGWVVLELAPRVESVLFDLAEILDLSENERAKFLLEFGGWEAWLTAELMQNEIGFRWWWIMNDGSRNFKLFGTNLFSLSIGPTASMKDLAKLQKLNDGCRKIAL